MNPNVSLPLLILAFSQPSQIVEYVLALLLFLALDSLLFFKIKRLYFHLSATLCEIAVMLGYLFEMPLLWATSLVFFALIVGMAVFSHFAELRETLKAPDFFRFGKKDRQGVALFDRDEVYGKIRDAVLDMARHKVGALITLQRKDSLKDSLSKDAVLMDAPVSAELIETIFYKGTRLHDGAIVIVNDKIMAAAVYYTPTTRPQTGKFGSRHRAALGISEVTDSVTILVSEETGHIGLAYQGEFLHCTPDNFYDAFVNLMKED